MTPLESKGLFNQNNSTQTTFSTSFQKSYTSFIDYGTPDTNQYSGSSVTLDVGEDYFWSALSGGIRIGSDNKRAFSYEIDPTQSVTGDDQIYTIFDSATPEVYISELWYESVIAEYFGSMSMIEGSLPGDYQILADGTAVFQCLAYPADIFYMVEGYWLQLSGVDLQGEYEDELNT